MDPFASRYKKADEAAEIIANNILAASIGARGALDRVLTKDSKETPSIQLCDLLLGAVMAAWRQEATRDAKAEVQQFVAEHLGWPDLRADTHPPERKFNVWWFHDPTQGPRAVTSRKVQLKYALPAHRPRR